MVKQPGLFLPKLGTMSSHIFTQSPQNFAVEPGIYSLASWDKFFMHNSLDVKESYDHALEIAFHPSGLFGPWWRGAFPLGGLSLCLRIITVYPALITSNDPRQERFVVRRLADEVQCRRWRAAASGQMSGSWAQIWLRHAACPILPSEPIGMSHNQRPPPQRCHEWSNVDPDEWSLEFVQQ